MSYVIRKPLRILVSLMLISAFLLSACACAKTEDQDQPEPSQTPAQTTAAQPAQTSAPAPSLLLGDADVSEYTIVYETPRDKAILGSRWKSEYDAGRVTAERLAELIKAKFGVTLEIYADVARKEHAREILIGNTDRDESASAKIYALKDDDYFVGMDGKKLVICGGEKGTTWHAVDSLEAFLNTETADGKYAITAETDLSGSYHLKRIAILGDSISYGALSTNYKENDGALGYAKMVGRIWWQECTVQVWAQPGICMRSDLGGFPTSPLLGEFYMASRANPFDVVLIMLGCNDSYTDTYSGGTWQGVWTEADDQSFLSSAKMIVNKADEANPDAKIVMMNCVAYYRTKDTHTSHYHSSPRVLSLQAQSVTDLKAEGYDIHLYDMNAYTTANTTSSMFPDLLHPGDVGHEIMARGVIDMLKLLFEGKTDTYLIN